MKWILSLTLVLMSMTSLAYDITKYSGKCFEHNEKNAFSCSIDKGVSSGGKFVYIEFDKKEFLIEQSTSCGGKCKPYLGTTPENVLSAKNYKKDQWSCYKQEQGKMNICYAISK